MTSGKFGIIAVYGILLLLNAYGFRKLPIGHESNFYLRYLMKKIGVIPTQIITLVAVICFVLVFPMDSFIEGLLFGAIFFNICHDYYILSNLLDEQAKQERKKTE